MGNCPPEKWAEKAGDEAKKLYKACFVTEKPLNPVQQQPAPQPVQQNPVQQQAPPPLMNEPNRIQPDDDLPWD